MKSDACDGDKKITGHGHGRGFWSWGSVGYENGDGRGYGLEYGYRDGDGYGDGNGYGSGFDPKDTPNTIFLNLTITHSEDLRSDVILTLTRQLIKYA